MKRVLYFLLLCIISNHISHCCLAFSKQNVKFNSVNFEFILQWERWDLSPDAVFSVQYKRYGDVEWSIKRECQNITRLFCNLTDEISSDAEELKENAYYGQVKASSNNCSSDWVMSKRMHPIDDTHISQPEVNYVQDVRSITVLVRAPFILVKNKNGQQQTLEDIYSDSFEYHMSLSRLEGRVMWRKSQLNKTFEVTGLNPDTKYNGSAYILLNNERKSDINYFVVKTLPDQSLFTLVICGFTVAAGFLGIGLLLLIYRYVKQKGQTPSSLNFEKKTTFHPMSSLIESHLNDVSSPVHIIPSSVQLSETTESQNSGKINYKSQFHDHPVITVPDFTTPEQSSYCSQQCRQVENNKISVVDYGMFENDRANGNPYQHNSPIIRDCNHFPYHAQMNQVGTLLDYHDKSQMGMDELSDQLILDIERKCGRPNVLFSFSCPEENTCMNINNPQTLLSTVKVHDSLGLGAQIDQTVDLEEEQSVLLAGLSNCDGLQDKQPEKPELEQSLLPFVGKSYLVQCPIKNTETDQFESRLVCQEPYLMQHRPVSIPIKYGPYPAN